MKIPPDEEADPEAVAAASRGLEDAFKFVDLTHPALKEIFRISVAHRSRHLSSDAESTDPSRWDTPAPTPREGRQSGEISLTGKNCRRSPPLSLI